MERLRCLSASTKLTLRGVNCTDSVENGMGVMVGRDDVVATGEEDFEDLPKNIVLSGDWVGEALEGPDSDGVEEDGVEYTEHDF